MFKVQIAILLLSTSLAHGFPNGPCAKDTDCALFLDECGEVEAVLRDSLSVDVISEEVNGKTHYMLDAKDSVIVCEKMFILAPPGPEHYDVKCIKKQCNLNRIKAKPSGDPIKAPPKKEIGK